MGFVAFVARLLGARTPPPRPEAPPYGTVEYWQYRIRRGRSPEDMSPEVEFRKQVVRGLRPDLTRLFGEVAAGGAVGHAAQKDLPLLSMSLSQVGREALTEVADLVDHGLLCDESVGSSSKLKYA